MPTIIERLRGALGRLAGTVRRRDIERRLADEMQFHLDMHAERTARTGVAPDEARRAAIVAFGGRDRFTEETRDAYRSRVLEDAVADVRYALRALRRAPVFASTAVLTLALGIGATTVIFSVVDHVVLRPLAYAGAGRLVVVREIVKELSGTYPSLPVNAGHYVAWRRDCTRCEDVAALRPIGLTLSGDAEPERLGAARVSANLLPMLGARPLFGRLFTAEDDQPGHEKVAMLSESFWRRRFGGDRSVVGRVITLNDNAMLVVGVLPASFRLPRGGELGGLIALPMQTDVYVPLALQNYEINTQGGFDFAVVARLREGTQIEQARAQLDAIESDIMRRTPEPLGLRVLIVPLREQVVGAASRGLVLLLAAVGAVLLIVCVNLASLLLARNAGRARESAVRVALGAARERLVRLALTESIVLALLAGTVGIVLSRWGLSALLRVAPTDLPRFDEVQLDGRVIAVALALSLVAGVAVGIFPALRAGRTDPGDALKSGGRSATLGRAAARGRGLLIASQVGISTVLLVAAGLFLASFVRVLRVDKGFDVERVLAMDVVLSQGSYSTAPRVQQFYDRLLAQLAAAPGVKLAAITNRLPLDGETEVNSLNAEHDTRPLSEHPFVNVRFVSPGYFATLGVPLRRGRAFDDGDRGRNVVILSERAAAALWPGADPIGRRASAQDDAEPSEVVGIVADVPTTSLEQPGSLIAYFPHWLSNRGAVTVLLRSTTDPTALAAEARTTLRSIDPRVPITKVRAMSELVSAAVAHRRFQLTLLALFAATALVTAAVGIYGVIAQSLARRTTEIGIRMALGARAADIHRLIMREGLRPVAAGLGAGLAAALVLGRAFGSLLFGVSARDPLILGGVALLLGAVAALACYAPARSATRVGAAAALRAEN